MKWEMLTRSIGVLILVMLCGASAQATLVTFFGDQPGFSAQGVITQFGLFSKVSG